MKRKLLSRFIAGLKAVLLLSTILCSHALLAQNITNKGTDFWVGYGHHQFMETGDNSMDMVLYLSNTESQTAVVTVTIDSSGALPTSPWKRIYNIPANTVISTGTAVAASFSPVSIGASGPMPKTGPYDARLYTLAPPFSTGGAGVFRKKGIHITSSIPIVAYAHIYGSASSGATMLLPTNAWGYSYMSVNSNQEYASNCYSWMYVIAKENNTKIEITCPVLTRASNLTGIQINQPYYVTLNKGQIYQIIGANSTSDANGNGGTSATGLQLTGTRVRSIANPAGDCYPIAVFSGSSRTTGDANCGSGGGDNDNQQCFPMEAWGKRYLTAPTSSSNSPSTFMTNLYKIAVKDPSTVVKRNGSVISPGSLINNAYYYFETSTADYIEADKPIMVAQFLSGGCLNGGVGDPEMMYLSPIEQAIKKVGFYRNTLESINFNYLTLIIPTQGINSLRIDGTLFSSIPAADKHYYPHPNLAGYSIAIKRWPSAQAQSFAESDSSFNAVTYGLGSVESYGYNAGTYLNNLNLKPAIHNVIDTTQKDHPFTCTQTEFDLNILVAYKPTYIGWELNTITGLTPNANVSLGSTLPYITPIDSVSIDGRWYYRYKAPGGPYKFSATGSYTIPVRLSHPAIENCYHSEILSITVDVKQKPIADFTYSHSGCLADSVRFNGPNATSTGNSYTIKYWGWKFDDGSTDIRQNPGHLYFAGGSYPVKLQVASSEGCVSDTVTKTVVVGAGPQAKFTVSPPEVCEGQVVTLTPNASLSSTDFIWIYGEPGKKNDTLHTNTPVQVTYNTYGKKYIQLKLAAVGGCNPSSVDSVMVWAKPVIGFQYPAGCLPSNGIVTFTDTTKVPDVTAINSRLWYFADPAASGSNPNTATTNPASHTYAVGTYNGIKLTVTTVKGCSKDSTFNSTFNISPSLAFPAISDVCENAPPFTITGSVTNSVPGAGIFKSYKNAITNASSGLYDPKLAGAGVDTVWYVYTATSGCTDSLKQWFTIKASPKVGFEYPQGGCLNANGTALFKDTTKIAAPATITGIAWNFGDVSSASNTATTSPVTHNYTADGNYTIKLVATANNGCVDSLSVTAAFSKKPALTFPALADVCETVLPFNVNVVPAPSNGVSGSGVYKSFKNAVTNATSGLYDPKLAGIGVDTVYYIYTTSGGCMDSVKQWFTIKASPKVGFEYPQGGCLNANGTALFKDTTKIAAPATITGIAWNFGDIASASNTATTSPVTHNYTADGNYTIKLVATANNGCVDSLSVTAAFSKKPALTFPALADVCETVQPFNVNVVPAPSNGVSGAGTYKSYKNAIVNANTGLYNPQLAGTGVDTVYYIFTTTGGCIDSVKQWFTIKPSPKVGFDFTPNTACLNANGSVVFTDTSKIAAPATITTRAWNFGDIASSSNTASTVIAPHNFTADGTYTVKLIVTANNGCVDSASLTRAFNKKPALSLPKQDSVCENTPTYTIKLGAITNGASGPEVYTSFKNAITPAGVYDPSKAGYGMDTIYYTVTSAAGCSETVKQPLFVKAKPKVNFTFPQSGCLPTNGAAQFNGTATVQGSTIKSYAWNFDYPSTNASDLSSQQNPIHYYTVYKTYTVVLTATANNGCVGDSTVVTPFNIKPAVSFGPVIKGVCINGADVILKTTYPGSITNGVTALYESYKGTGIADVDTLAGIFKPSVAGTGIKTITYNVMSVGGCFSSATATIKVFPKPTASFNAPTDVCLDKAVSITAIQGAVSSNLGGAVKQWKWWYGNNTPVDTKTTNASFTKTYSTAGAYTIKMVAVSDSSCVSDTATDVVNIRTIPVASFTAPPFLCMPKGVITLTAESTNAEGSGMTHKWDFGDASSTVSGSPVVHTYQTIPSSGFVNIKLTSTSIYGCADDSVYKFSNFLPKPNIKFTVTPMVVCQGQPHKFKNESQAVNSSFTGWKWDFGDGTFSNDSVPPNKIYTKAGNYNIKLTATNLQGCAGDLYTQTVTVNYQPKVDAGNSIAAAQGNTIQILATGNDTSKFNILWKTSTGVDPFMQDPTVLQPYTKVSKTDWYHIYATAPGNCTDHDSVKIIMLEPVVIPNAFSPNGDGVNDKWEIKNLSVYPGATVEIFDRGGHLVYSVLNGYSTPWDGTRSGKPLPVGVYYYIINLKNGFSAKTGYVTILR